MGSSEHDERLTQEGIIQGTPAFMSPEQALADDVDPRSDIYSLGALAFFLLTGEAPCVRDTSAQLRLAHINELPVFPERASITVPQDLQSVVMRCLEKD